VDDDPSLLLTSKLLLEIQGYEVFTAEDSLNALSISNHQEINLAIIDFNLPLMTGDMLAEKLNDNQPSMKFIFISGQELDQDINNLGFEVIEVLLKPVEPQALIDIVKNI
jgi:DNA-binding NtrC family response regulator